MASRASNGRGSIYHRKDGRYQVAVRMKLPDGTSKRTFAVVKSRPEAEQLLHDKLEQVRRGIPTPVKEWTVGNYLDYWMREVVGVNRRPRTVESYDMYIRLYLKPALGRKHLRDLSVHDVQTVLNTILGSHSVRLAQGTRSVLRAALHRAMREELLARNVASLTELPAWHRKRITPWTAGQASTFLRTSEGEPWHLGYLLLLVYGMRRGEVLGLRWSDIDLDRGTIQVEQQLQRVDGKLVTGPVKTEAGRRTLPVLPMTRQAILDHLALSTGTVNSPALLQQLIDDEALVFISKVGTPVDPKNFVRTFHLLRVKAGLPRITVHHTRHTAATVLKDLGVPARDAQLILGHAQITTTQQLYQHGDITSQTKALSLVEEQLLAAPASVNGGQNWWSNKVKRPLFTEKSTFYLGGSSETRTHDTLLKSPSWPLSESLPAPVARRVRALLIAYKIGAVVVKIGGQNRHPIVNARSQTSFIADLHDIVNRSDPTTLSEGVHNNA